MRPLLFFLIGLFPFITLADPLKDSLLVEGIYRSFYYNTPPDSKGGALVFVMHGSGGNGLDMMGGAKAMDEIARREGVTVVYPNGYKNFWNECRKASPAEANKIDINEEAFFKAMINHFHKKHAIDRKKVFAVGTSGGGHMAYKLAMTMPEDLRGIVAIIANLPAMDNMDCTPRGKALPVMIVNGTEDTVNPYDGGEVKIAFSLGFVRSTDETFNYWAKLAGHKEAPVKEMIPDTNPQDGKIIERLTYHKAGLPEVTLLKVIGGKHDYPGDIDVHVEALRFCQRQIKR